MRRVRLMDGTMVHAPSVFEARVIDREVGETNSYFRHGITLPPDACVFDVGANAGLFAVRLLQRCPALRLYSFEPIPDVYAILLANVAEHGATARVRTFNVALGDAPGEAIFELDPRSTFAASMAGDAVDASIEKHVSAHAFADAALGDLALAHLLDPRVAGALRRALAWPLLGWLIAAPLAGAAAVQKRASRRRTQRIRCPVSTLSAVLDSENVTRVDLLKVDVEGAEESVLDGIALRHWPRIQQVVAEIHDAGGRAARVDARLRTLGFVTVLDREEWQMHRLLGIRTLYARRT